MRLAGFAKVRNEIIREGNLYRMLDQLDSLCDGGVLCDDASTDGTREHLIKWVEERPSWTLLLVDPANQNWRKEMHVKQEMLGLLHALPDILKPSWIFWADADEFVVDTTHRRVAFHSLREAFHHWLDVEGEQADAWAFHYTQLWRSTNWARTDSGFDHGWFWKLWRYRSDLEFELSSELHSYQFPKNYYKPIMTAVNQHSGSHGAARRAPFDVLHLGNVGKNLQWKAISYRNSGPLEEASLDRHLYFGQKKPRLAFRHVDPPGRHLFGLSLVGEHQPMPFTPEETKLVEQMGTLKQQKGLCVVIVPTFNRGSVLNRTLASVMNQTYPNWVCVVLDDGSTDTTAERMREWVDRDPRFFYCRYPENRGGVAMNEIGMALAVEFGEFWVRLGSDDYFLPHKLELDVAAFRCTDDGVVWGPYRDLHGTDSVRDIRNTPTDARGALLSRGFATSWANIAVRSSLLKQLHERHGVYCDQKIRNMEDFLVNRRLSYFTEFSWRGLVRKTETGDEVDFVVGARSIKDVGNQPSRIVHDAVWHIGADGASQKPEQCGRDAVQTFRLIEEDEKNFTPEPRTPTRITRIERYIIGGPTPFELSAAQ